MLAAAKLHNQSDVVRQKVYSEPTTLPEYNLVTDAWS